MSWKLTVPVGIGSDKFRFVTLAVNVSGWPATTVRRSGIDDVTVTRIFVEVPSANSVLPLSEYIVQSGPIPVGTYVSPPPALRAIASVNEFEATFQRYTRPSSLGAKMLLVAGLTAAALMHHSRTAYGYVVPINPLS